MSCVYHPPVITMFIYVVCLPFPNGWFIIVLPTFVLITKWFSPDHENGSAKSTYENQRINQQVEWEDRIYWELRILQLIAKDAAHNFRQFFLRGVLLDI